jgi:hypothetical protein
LEAMTVRFMCDLVHPHPAFGHPLPKREGFAFRVL